MEIVKTIALVRTIGGRVFSTVVTAEFTLVLSSLDTCCRSG